MKEVKLTFSDDEYEIIRRVSDRRRRSIRSLLLKFCRDLDSKDEMEFVVKGRCRHNPKTKGKANYREKEYR